MSSGRRVKRLHDPVEPLGAPRAHPDQDQLRYQVLELPGLRRSAQNRSTSSASLAALDALAAIEGGYRIAVLGEMRELGDDREAEHRAVGEYAASRADVVAAVGEAARPIADGAGDRAVALSDNDVAVDWLRDHLAAGGVVLVKASRGARLDEVAAALV
jgi:UDP-N-acetylmuramoyl-tripeptide--D-alanyl-D-alanine ligase